MKFFSSVLAIEKIFIAKMNEFQLRKKEIPGVRKGVSMKNHTTFKIGGPACLFISREAVKNKNQL